MIGIENEVRLEGFTIKEIFEQIIDDFVHLRRDEIICSKANVRYVMLEIAQRGYSSKFEALEEGAYIKFTVPKRVIFPRPSPMN